MKRTRKLRECEYGCGAVDEDNGRIEGVKLLGRISQNRREYTPQCIADAASLFEGCPSFMNHPDRPADVRRVEDRLGWISDVWVDESGAWGTLNVNPKHSYWPTLKWFAVNRPSAVGMSINARGAGSDIDGVFRVEKVVSCSSIDLVALPATTKGLTESTRPGSGRTNKGPTMTRYVTIDGRRYPRRAWEVAMRQVQEERQRASRPGLSRAAFREAVTGLKPRDQLRRSIREMAADPTMSGGGDMRAEVAQMIGALIRKGEMSGDDLKKKVCQLIGLLDGSGDDGVPGEEESVESVGRGRKLTRSAFRAALKPRR